MSGNLARKTLKPAHIASGMAGKKSKMTPIEIIRKYCLSCVGGNYKEVENCTANKPTFAGYTCALWPFRMGNNPRRKNLSKIIRKFCTECMNGTSTAIKECDSKICPFVPYRFGKNPAGRRLPSAKFVEAGKRHQFHRKKNL